MKTSTINKIAGYRKMLNLSQEQVGMSLGISAQAYGQKENGKVDFKDSEKVKLLEILKEADSSLSIERLFF